MTVSEEYAQALRDLDAYQQQQDEIIVALGSQGMLPSEIVGKVRSLLAENTDLKETLTWCHSRLLMALNQQPFSDCPHLVSKIETLGCATPSTRQEPNIHRGEFHHPDCNYWKWDWRYSWDVTDCNCDDVSGPSEPADTLSTQE